MSKGKRHLDNADPFAENTPFEVTFEDLDTSVYGSLKEIDANRQVASPLSIHEIQPDPSQPRRAIPAAVRSAWDGTPKGLPTMFEAWLALIAQERDDGTGLVIQEHISAAHDTERPETMGGLELRLMEVLELASSIYHDGLTNPITVAPQGTGYILETGERRWLAYHMLHLYSEDPDRFAKIPARIVEQVDIWRQAAENNARANLNAVGVARQFAVLLMDLLAEKGGENFLPMSEFEHEQDYYSQVADGNAYRIPRGTSERLLNATGLKNPQQLRFYRRLLALPHTVWEWADDYNWTEYFVRSLREQATNDDELILLAHTALESGITTDAETSGGLMPPAKGQRTRNAKSRHSLGHRDLVPAVNLTSPSLFA